MKSKKVACAILLTLLVVGCGEEKPQVVMPNGQLTPQQIVQAQKDEAKITEEESYGTTKYVAPPSDIQETPTIVKDAD